MYAIGLDSSISFGTNGTNRAITKPLLDQEHIERQLRCLKLKRQKEKLESCF
ncbi:hypothetical protein RchiOBHm_Chr5g0022691 [Rosa chinensis]|uniref:Uncharacterized protein n=1 Tax=Rosa chinensis TaxID=74649 RepID=A0A2P6Q7W0_ROSCH|nr:hypothetical protein RchiOBHm_Chr5g0022691 [Rosa chinensis]